MDADGTTPSPRRRAALRTAAYPYPADGGQPAEAPDAPALAPDRLPDPDDDGEDALDVVETAEALGLTDGELREDIEVVEHERHPTTVSDDIEVIDDEDAHAQLDRRLADAPRE